MRFIERTSASDVLCCPKSLVAAGARARLGIVVVEWQPIETRLLCIRSGDGAKLTVRPQHHGDPGGGWEGVRLRVQSTAAARPSSNHRSPICGSRDNSHSVTESLTSEMATISYLETAPPARQHLVTHLPSLRPMSSRDDAIELSVVRSSISTSVDTSPTIDASLTSHDDPTSGPPDGGYGWVIVMACWSLSFFSVGNTYSWGIMQASLANDHLAPTSTLSFIQGLATSFISVLAIVNARLIRRLGARNTGLVGTALFAGGQILSGWSARSVSGLFMTAGVMMGVGLSLLFMVFSVMPAQYFTKRRGLANGIIYSGGGIGGAAQSYALDALCRRFGTAWAFRINGLVTLAVLLPMVFLMRERVVAATTSRPAWPQWRLFKDSKFVSLWIAGCIGTFPLLVPPFFIPLYAQSLGLSSTAGASLLAGYNLASAAGRIGFGQLSDTLLGPIDTLLLVCIVGGISSLTLWPLSTTLAPLIAFCVLNGAANGGFFSMMPTVVGAVFGPSQMAVAMGMVVSGWAGGYLMGAPIAGYLLAAYGGQQAGLAAFRPAMYYAGSLSLASGGAILALRQLSRR